MPAVSRFGGKRAAKKQTIIEKLKAFFERFFGIGDSDLSKRDTDDDVPGGVLYAAEEGAQYGKSIDQ